MTYDWGVVGGEGPGRHNSAGDARRAAKQQPPSRHLQTN